MNQDLSVEGTKVWAILRRAAKPCSVGATEAPSDHHRTPWSVLQETHKGLAMSWAAQEEHCFPWALETVPQEWDFSKWYRLISLTYKQFLHIGKTCFLDFKSPKGKVSVLFIQASETQHGPCTAQRQGKCWMNWEQKSHGSSLGYFVAKFFESMNRTEITRITEYHPDFTKTTWDLQAEIILQGLTSQFLHVGERNMYDFEKFTLWSKKIK